MLCRGECMLCRGVCMSYFVRSSSQNVAPSGRTRFATSGTESSVKLAQILDVRSFRYRSSNGLTALLLFGGFMLAVGILNTPRTIPYKTTVLNYIIYTEALCLCTVMTISSCM